MGGRRTLDLGSARFYRVLLGSFYAGSPVLRFAPPGTQNEPCETLQNSVEPCRTRS
jgi:hypothetical protein